MSTELVVAIVTALIAGPVGAYVISLLNRDKDDTTLKAQITASARELMAEYKEQADRLQDQVKELQTEVRIQANTLENLNAQILKYRLALVITVMQLRLAGFEPMIDPTRIDTMSTDELRLVAEGIRNVEQRQKKWHKTKDDVEGAAVD